LQKEIKKHVLSAALKKGVADGTLVQVKASYKLSAEAKKKKPAAKKKAAPKKKVAPKKKTATKKKVSLHRIRPLFLIFFSSLTFCVKFYVNLNNRALPRSQPPRYVKTTIECPNLNQIT